MNNSTDYQQYLLDSLQNQKEAAGYLNTSLEDGDTAGFLLALQNVVQAQGGFAKIANKLHRSRTSLYKTLSRGGNPYLETTRDLLSVLGLRLKIVSNT
ncbi:MAG: transcriptional regulator [Gammaproteobacteria bacterium]|nr:transcriptional regulator [Gammaproteobacteria bacterium]